MDPTSALKSDILRPIVTILIPGGLAFTPVMLLAGHEYGCISQALTNRLVPTALLLAAAFLVTGFVLENIGSQIEHFILEPLLRRKYPRFDATWDEYMTLEIKDELIGQRFLHTILVRLKFELAMAPSLVVTLCGTWWLNRRLHFVAWWPSFGVFAIVVLLLALFLCYEAYRSADTLADTRAVIVTAKKPSPLVLPA